MTWVLVFIMFNNGIHYAQSQPVLYTNKDVCEIAAKEVSDYLNSTKPIETAYAKSYCLALPTDV